MGQSIFDVDADGGNDQDFNEINFNLVKNSKAFEPKKSNNRKYKNKIANNAFEKDGLSDILEQYEDEAIPAMFGFKNSSPMQMNYHSLSTTLNSNNLRKSEEDNWLGPIRENSKPDFFQAQHQAQ
uniref:Uncharacterized protein n=1 Tax=Strombidium rassoulzadegani TaxID=1082188 RepID=A0A7S3CJN0_9SPIT|mmetsp:Transcript_13187/g.22361  ORF Transcript_13187/g.22361 Transcript_13187/m.22361 type:complete len:125 (+) Transcript_13187:966-1340(+)